MKKHSLIFVFLCLPVTTNLLHCMNYEESDDCKSNKSPIKLIQWTTHKYKHHLPPSEIWAKKIIKSTKHGPAKYRPDINIEELERAVWHNGTPTSDKSIKIMEFNEEIGATSGKKTKFIRVEINDVNAIHGRPLTPERAIRALEMDDISPVNLTPYLKSKKRKRKKK